MAKDSKRPAKYVPRREDTLTQLKAELHRRGMSDAEIAATLRKKKRRKPMEFGIVKAPHVVPFAKTPPKPDKAHRPPPARMADELWTVETAAERLKMHPKTILRFIRKGKLRATRIGKSYRIVRADVEAFAGLPLPNAPSDNASMTSIVDVPDVTPELAQKWAMTIASALNTRPDQTRHIRADTMYEPERAHLKIVVMGAPNDTVNLLNLIRLWLDQLKP